MATHTPMSHRRKVRALLLGTILAIVPASAQALSPIPSASPISSSSSAKVPPVVTLLDPGAEPRTELRYRYPSNAELPMTIDMDLEFQFQIDGSASQTIAVPTTRMVSLLRTGQVAADGSVRYEFEYTDLGTLGDPADPMVVAMQAQYAALRGLSGWAIIDDRGGTLDGGIDALPSSDPTLQATIQELEASITQTSAPLPVEPVGVGARWQVVLQMQSQGIAVQQTMVYTLDGLDGGEVQLSMTVVPSAEPGPIDLPAAPGIAVELLEVTGGGDGTMVLSLDGLVPTSDAHTNVRMKVEAAGQRMDMTTDTQMRVRPTAEPIPVATTLATPLPTEPIPDSAASSTAP